MTRWPKKAPKRCLFPSGSPLEVPGNKDWKSKLKYKSKFKRITIMTRKLCYNDKISYNINHNMQ